MTMTELLQCKQDQREIYHCHNSNLLRETDTVKEGEEDDCILHLYNLDYKGMNKSCNLHLSHREDTRVVISDREYFLSSSDDINGAVTCGNATQLVHGSKSMRITLVSDASNV
jgi:hypothetical protein